MRTPKAITVAWLERHKACGDPIELFAQTFGGSADLTPGNITRAADAGLDLDWLAGRILPATAWAEFERARAPARAEYERARTTALIALLWPEAGAAGDAVGISGVVEAD